MAKEIACKDCKHFRYYRHAGAGAYCYAPQTRTFSSIFGESYGESCHQMRMVGGKCGPDAVLYARKPKPLWKRVVVAFTDPKAFFP